MSILDNLTEYRVVKVALPRQGGELQSLDGVAKTTQPPQFEITFLPDQLQPSSLDQQGQCVVSFEGSGSNKSIKAKIVKVVSDAKLLLEVLEAFTHTQKRAYFRVDAELSVSYWVVDKDKGNAQSVRSIVNLSGGGLRIPVAEDFPEGTELGIELILDSPEMKAIECTARVVRMFHTTRGLQAALAFSEIEEDDQDAIVAFCLAEQRKQLRLKVQLVP